MLRLFSNSAGARCCEANAHMGQAEVFLWEDRRPQIKSVSDEIRDRWIDPTDWPNDGYHTFTARAEDEGLGVKQAKFRRPTPGGGVSIDSAPPSPCDGSRDSPCPRGIAPEQPLQWTWGYRYDDLPEGINQLGLLIEDIVGNVSAGTAANPSYDPGAPGSWQVRVDRTPPNNLFLGGIASTPEKWFKEGSYDLTFASQDAHSGIRWEQLFTRSNGGGWTSRYSRTGQCDAFTGCPKEPPSTTHTWQTSGYPEGAIDFKVKATDPLGNPDDESTAHTSVGQFTVKLDRTPPSFTTTWDPLISSGQRLWEDEYKATISATDMGSGIKRAELLVDGVRLRADHLFERASACDSCGLTHPFTLRTEDLTPGDHTISLYVEDFAGNQSSIQSWQVYVALGGGDLPQFRFDTYPGNADLDLRVNLGSGNLLVTSRDVRDPEMDINRFYNSEWSGRRGPLGKGWTLNTGADVRLREARDGSIVYYGPSHYAVRFTRNANGSYSPPSLFVGSLTRRADGTYTVDDFASGETFEFASATSRMRSLGSGGATDVTVAYNGDGTLSSLTDFDDRMTTFTSTSGRITAATLDEAEPGHSYSYTTADLLQTSVSPSSGTTSYSYDSMERLREITLPDGTRFEVTYEDGSRTSRVASVKKYASASSTPQTTTYSYSGDQTTVTRPTGIAVYRHDANFQVYTSDTDAPQVYQPFGDDFDPSDPTSDGAYTNGAASIAVDVTVDDPASGVKRAWLERVGSGAIGEITTTCAQLPGTVGFVSVCPPRLHGTITIATGALPEGATSFRLNATDGADNAGSAPSFDLLVDKTAPPAPTEVALLDFDEPAREAHFRWTYPSDDPDLPTGEDGSGLGSPTYRYRKAGLGATWSAWLAPDPDEDVGLIPGADRGQAFEVEVRVADVVGNVSATTGATLTIGDPPAEAPEEFGSLPAGTATLELTANTTIAGESDPDYATTPAGVTQVSVSTPAGQRAVKMTDDNGKVTFSNIAAGTYEVALLAQPSSKRSVSVTSGETRQESHTITMSEYKATSEEKKFCRVLGHKKYCNAFKADAEDATTMTALTFDEPEKRSEGTKMNAFKHALWVAWMVRSIAHSSALDNDNYYYAWRFSKAHESDSRKGDLGDRRNTKMDYHNNGVGYRWSVAHEPDGDGIFHNDEFLCNTIRHKVYKGRFSRFRRFTTRFKQRPRRSQLVWIRRKHRETRRKPHLIHPTRCGVDLG